MTVIAADSPSKHTTITPTRVLPSRPLECVCCVVLEEDAAGLALVLDADSGAEVDPDSVGGLLDVVLVEDDVAGVSGRRVGVVEAG